MNPTVLLTFLRAAIGSYTPVPLAKPWCGAATAQAAEKRRARLRMDPAGLQTCSERFGSVGFSCTSAQPRHNQRPQTEKRRVRATLGTNAMCDGGHRSLRVLRSLFLQHSPPASSPPPPSCASASPISSHHRLKRQLINQTQTPAFYGLVGTFGACPPTNKSAADRAIWDQPHGLGTD